MEIKEVIKRRRIELGYNMKDLANKVGVSEATISRWESGDIANMKRDKIKALSDALMISPAIIMGWEEPKVAKTGQDSEYNKNTKKEREMIKKYRVLDDHGQEVVDTVLQIEYDRVTADDEEVYRNAAHDRTDIDVSDDLRKHDDDMIDSIGS